MFVVLEEGKDKEAVVEYKDEDGNRIKGKEILICLTQSPEAFLGSKCYCPWY